MYYHFTKQVEIEKKEFIKKNKPLERGRNIPKYFELLRRFQNYASKLLFLF